jgi:hypothetical protein
MLLLRESNSTNKNMRDLTEYKKRDHMSVLQIEIRNMACMLAPISSSQVKKIQISQKHLTVFEMNNFIRQS